MEIMIAVFFQYLCKTTNGITTKYVYGLGSIGEETNNVFTTYHFDSRGSIPRLPLIQILPSEYLCVFVAIKLYNKASDSSIPFGKKLSLFLFLGLS